MINTANYFSVGMKPWQFHRKPGYRFIPWYETKDSTS